MTEKKTLDNLRGLVEVETWFNTISMTNGEFLKRVKIYQNIFKQFVGQKVSVVNTNYGYKWAAKVKAELDKVHAKVKAELDKVHAELLPIWTRPSDVEIVVSLAPTDREIDLTVSGTVRLHRGTHTKYATYRVSTRWQLTKQVLYDYTVNASVFECPSLQLARKVLQTHAALKQQLEQIEQHNQVIFQF